MCLPRTIQRKKDVGVSLPNFFIRGMLVTAKALYEYTVGHCDCLDLDLLYLKVWLP